MRKLAIMAIVASLAGLVSLFIQNAVISTSVHAAAPRNPPHSTRWTTMETFKKPSAAELKKKLTAEQFRVTQAQGTEAPFKNPLWGNHADGNYVDVVSGEQHFSSRDKFDSAPLSSDELDAAWSEENGRISFDEFFAWWSSDG
jgi:hypothetical protein